MKKARKQICKSVGPERTEKPRGNYNIWYNKYSGERHETGRDKIKALTRCSKEKDSGQTRGNRRDQTYVCLKFARGCCPNGFECSWLHVTPNAEFNSKLEITKDCFGRDRHEDVRDDQSGTGSFGADDETQRTLYVGGICDGRDTQTCLYRHFGEWGDIENIGVLSSKGVAFVRYKHRANTEFAKEAMQNQSLDDNEILNIRWATQDPNPWIMKRKHKENQKMAVGAVINTNKELGVLGEPTEKRFFIDSDNLQFNEGTGYYPSTDYHYQNKGTSHTATQSLGVEGWSNSTQPKTLSDLVAWSQKQISFRDGKTLHSSVTNLPASKPKTNAIASLVSDYGSASESENEGE